MSRNIDNKSRSAATGTKLGKGARRALSKNADCIDDFLHIVTQSKTREEITKDLNDDALTLARVTRSTGCGRLEVTALNIDGCAFGKEANIEAGLSVPICGTLKFKGRSSTKADRANCMCVGDVIVLRGGFASAKMSPGAADIVRRKFDYLGLTYPTGFFSTTAAAATEDDVFEFDRTEQLEAEEAEVANLRAEAARAAAVRTGRAVAEEEDVNIDGI